MTVFSVVDVNDRRKALNSNILDYEDAVMSECAKRNNAEYIITRNLKDFSRSKVKAISIDEFIKVAGLMPNTMHEGE